MFSKKRKCLPRNVSEHVEDADAPDAPDEKQDPRALPAKPDDFPDWEDAADSLPEDGLLPALGNNNLPHDDGGDGRER